MTTPPPMFEWLYLARGVTTHAHALDRQYKITAECGVTTWTHWYGTGRQEEYDKAERLPKCAKCVKLVGASESGRHRPSDIK